MKRTCSFLLAGFVGLFNASADTGVTIYNQGIGVVRETIPLKLKAGINPISFDKATAQVRADSVVLRDPAAKVNFSILEQSYRNDPVSQSLMLQHFEGRRITFQKTHSNGDISTVKGRIIRSGYNPRGRQQSPIIEVDKKIQFSLPGQPLFPALSNDSILRPTLSWQIHSEKEAKLDAQLSYMTGGFTWEANYNVVAPEKGETVSLTGWITLKNQSGTSFKKTHIKLVAGDVNVVRDNSYGYAEGGAGASRSLSKTAAAPRVTEKSFDDFHLYSLPLPLDLRNQETKQIEFTRSAKLKAKKRYVYSPVSRRYHGYRSFNRTGSNFSKEVGTYWEFLNSKENGLGIPFPAGTIRFYRSDDSDGNLEFVGENRVDHTPKNEIISIKTGTAFDLLGDRKVKNFKVSRNKKTAHETIEITLTNRSKEEKTFIAREPMWRWTNWQIENPSMPFKKIDAHTIDFEVTVPADSKKTISFTAHYFDN